MGLKDKAKATAKKVEGKVEEAAGNLTGNHEAQAKGKAKQVEGEARTIAEDGKDNVKRMVD